PRTGTASMPGASGAREATYEAAPNIALVKYWGIRDPGRALPYNSSLSITLEGLRTRTTVRFEPRRTEDSLTLNGRPAVGPPLAAVREFLDRVRRQAGRAEFARVRSRNNFPTASGLASSASGFAALAGAASRAAGLDLSAADLSRLARFGSGSACRSVFGGFVEWQAGRRADGGDCLAQRLYPPGHWPTLVDLVCGVADAPQKEVRSAVAMQASVRTSPGFAARQRALPGRLRRIRAAIGRRDGGRLFPLLIEECDDFRAVCEGTRPSLDYLTATSRRILSSVLELNRVAGRPVAGYTHDAGAHVHLFTERADLPRLRAALKDLDGIARYWTLRPGPGGRFVDSTVR
ncbi:MAG: diphosphomevalonate decarboxylase, partial [Thermoplasmata archaeon]